MTDPTTNGRHTALLDGIGTASKRAVRLVAIYTDRCIYCVNVLSDDTRTIEHVIPKSQGGTNDLHNLRLACSTCNNMRGDWSYELFIAFRRHHPTGSAKQWVKYRNRVSFDSGN